MMTGTYRWKMAVSGVVIAAVMGGCASFDMGERASAKLNAAQLAGGAGIAEQAANPAAAASYAAKATEALSAGKSAEAVRWAEGAVLADPHHGGHRALLGQAYLQDGRFSAASMALDEAAQLSALSGDAVVALALAKVAEGDAQGAIEFLSNNADGLTASDLGLALSLAGDHDGALYVLGHAARDENASAQTRQNYSLALAMAGQWAQARLMAAQDLPLNRVEKRMLEFSALASAPDKKTQIAGLMGSKMRSDVPMPARLALANFPMVRAEALAAEAVKEQPVTDSAPLYAEAEVPQAPEILAAPAAPEVAVAAVADPAPVSPTVEAMVAALADEPVRAAPMMAAYEAPADADDIAAVQAASLAALFDVPVSAAPAMTAHAAPAPVPAAVQNAFALAQPVEGQWSVQVASLNSAERAKLAWYDLSARHHVAARLAASTHAARVGQRIHYRLTLDGFASSKDAQNLCNQLKASGQDCFVRRLDKNVAPLWAVRAQKAVQLAMR
jgi:Flp pilus assembly protein TadD